MARYTESVCRQCRREGEKLFLKGDRCYTAKCAIIKRHTPPGQHGQARQRKQSEYGLQLREKQKCRRAYGISESQFRKYYDMANFKDLREQGASKPIPKWLELDSENLTGKIAQMPQRDDIDLTVEENLIVEFYSR